MNIIVIDDTQLNLTSARQTLTGHNLILVDSHDEATRILRRETDYLAAQTQYQAEGLPKMYGPDWNGSAHAARWNEILEGTRPAPYDVALIDLMMPAGKYTQGPGVKFVGQMMGVGYPLALLAALKGAKFVGVVTATNHHHHPMAATIDHLSSAYWQEEPERCPAAFEINGARAGFFNAPFVGVVGVPCPTCNGSGKSLHDGSQECYACHGDTFARGKDWGKVLARLIGTG